MTSRAGNERSALAWRCCLSSRVRGRCASGMCKEVLSILNRRRYNLWMWIALAAIVTNPTWLQLFLDVLHRVLGLFGLQ